MGDKMSGDFVRKTYHEVYHSRIAKAETPDEVRNAAEKIYRYEIDVDRYTKSGKGWEKRANTNMAYILGYFNLKTCKLWFRTLPQLVHPVFGVRFGRGYWPTAKEAFAAGAKWAESLNKGELNGRPIS